jgi:protease-4
MWKKNKQEEIHPDWERGVVRKLAFAAIEEQRRSRRWGIFFKFLTFAYLLTLLLLWMPDKLPGTGLKVSGGHTALVDVKGVIADDAEASADSVITSLRDAFDDKNTKGVIVRINSPGGSPVQAAYIHDEIGRLKAKHEDIPVYAVVTDMCASGGYYVAAAADKIYVNESSVVGSIGVLMSSFGFVDGMDKLGVERRLLTSGKHKGLMDPFSPMSEFGREHVQTMLNNIHQQFIDVVRKGRGERLKESPETFSGLFWTGGQSIEMGLADALGSSSYVAREIIGAEDIVDFSTTEDLLERFARRLGAGAAAMLGGTWGGAGSTQLR